MHGNAQQPANLVLNKPASYLLRMEPHRESTGGSNKTAPAQLQAHFAEQLQAGFSGLFFFFRFRLRALFKDHVPRLSSSHIAVVQSSIAALTSTSWPSISFPWAVLCVVDFFVTLSSGPLDRETIRNNETKTSSSNRSTSNDFQSGSWMKISARRSTSALSETSPNSTQILPNPQFLFNFETLSCRKVVKTF